MNPVSTHNAPLATPTTSATASAPSATATSPSTTLGAPTQASSVDATSTSSAGDTFSSSTQASVAFPSSSSSAAAPTGDPALAADVQALRSQAHVQGAAGSKKSSGVWEDAKRTTCLLANGKFGDLACAADPKPALEEAIKTHPELGKPALSPTEAAELVNAGNGSIFPSWMLSLGPRIDVSHIVREGQHYDNGYKDWFKKDAETGEWQKFAGPIDDSGFSALGVPPGEGIPVSAGEDVGSWSPR